MTAYTHYLGIGATGMLSEATAALAARSSQQTLVARRASAYVAQAGLGNAVAADADWGDTAGFVGALAAALTERAPVDLCVLWLHVAAQPALPGVAARLSGSPCRVVHVLGSSAGDPRGPAAGYRAVFDAHPALTYHTATLGSVAEGGTRRWLTHAEISAGVLQCVERGSDIVVGELPWPRHTMPLILRELVDDDLPTLFEFQRDAESNRMAAFTAKDPEDRAAFEAHWAKVRAHETVTLRTIVVEEEDGGGPKVVGSILVHGWFDEPEVSFGIGRPYWGRGYATEALRLFLVEITRRPLHARAASDNAGSLRVLQKCGFVVTGTEQGFANARGCEIEETLLVLGA